MSLKSLRQHVHDHYAGQDLPAGKLAELASLAQAEARPAKTSGLLGRLGPLGALAAAVLIALNAWSLSMWQGAESDAKRAEQEAAAIRAAQADLPRRAGASTSDPTRAATAPALPRYVVVRSKLDNCPYCPGLQSQFDELERDFAGKDVAFVTLNNTTPGLRDEGQVRSHLYGIDWALPQCRDCCAIRLLDRQEHRIAAAGYSFGPPGKLRQQIDEFISGQEPGPR